MKARIQFKAKVRLVRDADQSIAYLYLPVPELTHHHCDMAAFRQHPRYGILANSDLFPGVLRKISREIFPHKRLRLDQVPPGVTVDTKGFLSLVTLFV